MSLLRRWLALRGPERLVVVEAAALLALAPLALRFLSLPRVMILTAVWRANPAGHSTHRLGSLVDAVAGSLPWRTTCLHRAVATAVVLNRRGVPYELHIGVRRHGDQLAAHAWIAGHVTSPDTYQSLVHWRSADLARR